MLFRNSQSSHVTELKAMLEAVGRSQAVIEFDLEGHVLSANENFLSVMGYTLEEIRGQHHAIFMPAGERDSASYKAFWQELREGKFRSGEFRRVAKDGSDVWIQASYNPIFGEDGKPRKFFKVASDITAQKERSAEHEGQVDAITQSQAVIEFDLNGTILTANNIFLDAMGYGLEDIRGKHHSMFVQPEERTSESYKAFWQSLRDGNFQAGEFKRVSSDGREIWIQATYTPIRDPAGNPVKVIKFATDITEQKQRSADHAGQIAAITQSQAVIEFDLDGNILSANDIFLNAMGYTANEVIGCHHSMFVTPEERGSEAYRAFWQSLRDGEFHSGEFQRVGKGGRDVWIQATYTPISDASGKPFKVVKFASDTTGQVLARRRAEHVRSLMENVASGAEQLNVSVRGIAASMAQSRTTSDRAFELVTAADQSTSRLSETAESMGGIVDAINNITGQINLLALNATIESARAGEAGRGFAVVANEVKNLASQAKAATEQIFREIEGMQGVSSDVVDSLASIRESIEEVRAFVTQTATEVEEQSAVANDMSASMQRASEEAAAMH